jgi:hypothetical protein
MDGLDQSPEAFEPFLHVLKRSPSSPQHTVG